MTNPGIEPRTDQPMASRDRPLLTVPAPAKVNLFLHVTGRRPDGYHLLESLFALVDLADAITLARREDGLIRRTLELEGVPAADDLALRAARVLQEASGTRFGVDVHVEKRIPLGGGLGGGSSDAASVLLALNRIWGLAMPRAELLRLGGALGADVPFFIGGDNAVARGVGDVLTPVSLVPRWIALAFPAAVVPTSSIFAAPELTRATPSAKMDVFSEGYGRNDLEGVAAGRYPAVAAAIDALSRGSSHARMTGSGACVFAAFATEFQARAALDMLPTDCAGRVVRTLARHPLAGFA
jgi:4-diphosphocytidyl-2-C-methyl-D-erythritol kinase